jgi:hypothetical protein
MVKNINYYLIGIIIFLLIISIAINYQNKENLTAPPKPKPSYINALDGNGNPVLWWFVIKLPSSILTKDIKNWGDDVLTKGDLKDNWFHSNDSYGFMRKIRDSYDGTYFEKMPACDKCKDPVCVNENTPQGLKDLSKDYPKSTKNRGKGLCYLYADSTNPQLKFFTEYKTSNNDTWGCLGQGGNDPLSKTLFQIVNAQKDTQWSFWSDQIYQSSDSWRGNTDFPKSLNKTQSAKNTIYPHPHAGCGRPGAHSKGVLAFNDTGGFLLQSSFPMYPDFSFSGQKGFVNLGCQLDNNVNFAQSCFCCSLPVEEFTTMEKMFKSTMVCSSRSPTCNPNASDSTNTGFGINPDILKCQSNNLYSGLKDAMSYRNYKRGSDKTEIELKINGSNNSSLETLTIVAKSQYNRQPGWMIVANSLKTDLSVLSWWSPDYGAPSLCKDTRYDDATNNFCLSQGPDILSSELNIEQPLWPFINNSNSKPGDLMSGYPNYSPKYNVEMILSLKFTESNIPGISNVLPTNLDKDKSVGFFTLGGVFDAGNHIKLGISTPSDSNSNSYWVVFGDMNHEGYPGTADCSKSQFGRGGFFLGLKNKILWTSIAQSINKICACTSDSVNSHRFCGQGAYPGLLWWDKGASTQELSTGHTSPTGTHQPWYFRQMKVDECVKHGVDGDKCIGTGYMEFGDFYNKGFVWPEYQVNQSTSFWNGKPNAWKWNNK